MGPRCAWACLSLGWRGRCAASLAEPGGSRKRHFLFSSRRRHTRSVSAFLLNRSSDLLVKDFLKVRCRLALLPFLISCLIWLDLVASLPLIKERILVIILLLHFLSLMLGSVLVLMLPLLVWLTP